MSRPKGIKHDSEKPRWSLVPWEEFEDVVKVLTLGSRKYEDFNWQYVDNMDDRYFSAAMRHLIAWRKGEINDPESGISHLAHAICNLLFLMWYDKTNRGEND